jgi:hypothetical protein
LTLATDVQPLHDFYPKPHACTLAFLLTESGQTNQRGVIIEMRKQKLQRRDDTRNHQEGRWENES